MIESGAPAVDRQLLDELTSIASQAAGAILAAKASGLQQRFKANNSPVTSADEAAEELVLNALARLMQGVPIVSEEASARGASHAPAGRFLLVDPLDGTREFIAGEDEYTVNIALIENGRPVAGVVAAPAMGIVWRGCAGLGAERLRLQPGQPVSQTAECTPIRTRPWPAGAPVAMTSRSHPDPDTRAYFESIPGVRLVACGSSLKFCRVAEGSADLYPRLVSLSEWDAAAGHAVVVAAGGAVLTTDGRPLTYGHPGFRLPPFVAWGEAPR